MKIKKIEILRAGVPAKNNHTYTRDELDEMVKKSEGNGGAIFGGSTYHFFGGYRFLADVSHVVDRMWREGDSLYVDITILDTPNGNILKNLVDENGEISKSISFFASGNIRVDENGVNFIDDVRWLDYEAELPPAQILTEEQMHETAQRFLRIINEESGETQQ
jgi:hypothetical protein